jgi:hypothetical protein
MDMVVTVGLEDGFDVAAPGGLACPNSAEAEAATTAASISWISVRSEYWAVATPPETPPGWNAFEPVLGLACLVFGIGVCGSEWVARLAHSGWFAGLEPQPEDLTAVDGETTGCWCLPTSCAETGHDVAGAALAFFEHGSIPNVPLTTVAVTPDAEQGDFAAALGLVAALRERRCGRGCRTAVVVTVEGSSSPALLALVRGLRDLGAFVVRPGMAAGGDHLHHFPLRAAVTPRGGRLVCVDLADHLACWAPGGVADLHVIPSAYDAAEQVFRRLADAGNAEGCGTRAVNLHQHFDENAPGHPLVEIDRLATACRAFLLAPNGNMIFTNSERLDGTTVTGDLLTVRDDYGTSLPRGH